MLPYVPGNWLSLDSLRKKSPVPKRSWLQVLELTSLLETQRQENHRSATAAVPNADNRGVWPYGCVDENDWKTVIFNSHQMIAEMNEHDDNQYLNWRFRIHIYIYIDSRYTMIYPMLHCKPKWIRSPKKIWPNWRRIRLELEALQPPAASLAAAMACSFSRDVRVPRWQGEAAKPCQCSMKLQCLSILDIF